MANRIPLVTGEWYHCYNRGTDKRVVFENPRDYERFLSYLYASNGEYPIHISDRYNTNLSSLLKDESLDRGKALVAIGAYALMPTHPHLILKQLRDGGIARFMQKVFTGYTMYFNLKRDRTGALFAGSFKSKHIVDDDYLKQVVAYVLLNPVELFEPDWKIGKADLARVERKLRAYPYSSLKEFMSPKTKTTEELARITIPMDEYYDDKPTLSRMLKDALEYYKQTPKVKP